MDTEWAVVQLDRFERMVSMVPGPDIRRLGQPAFPSRAEANRALQEQAEVVRRILHELGISTQSAALSAAAPWAPLLRSMARARVQLTRGDELDHKLGSAAPRLAVSTLHPWVWDAARDAWKAGQHKYAVLAAFTALNDRTQSKGQRPGLSEGDLFKQLFSTEEPKPGNPRLRLVGTANTRTFNSTHRGVSNYADGLYSAVRNVLSHTVTEVPKDEALELLAAISVLARWVDQATLQTAP